MLKQSTLMPMLLSKEDLEKLTGYKKPKQQREFLKSRGYPFDVNAKGVPVVGALYVAQSLGFHQANESHRKTEPNWNNLQAL